MLLSLRVSETRRKEERMEVKTSTTQRQEDFEIRQDNRDRFSTQSSDNSWMEGSLRTDLFVLDLILFNYRSTDYPYRQH